MEYGGAAILKKFEEQREKQQSDMLEAQRAQQLSKKGANARAKERERHEARAKAAAAAQPVNNNNLPGVYIPPEVLEPDHWPDLRDELYVSIVFCYLLAPADLPA